MKYAFRQACLIISISLLSFTAYSQGKSIRVGVEFPFQVAVGLENQFNDRFSIQGQFGVLMVPLNFPLLSELRFMGMSREATDVLESVLDFGTVAGAGARYYFNKHTLRNYVGPYFTYVNNYKSNVSDISVSNFFHQDMQTFPLGPKARALSSEPLTLSSKFFQLGLQYGYRIKTRRDDREICLEFSISKNVWSKHVIESDYRYLGAFKDRVNQELKDLYSKHMFITSVNIYYVFKTEYKRF